MQLTKTSNILEQGQHLILVQNRQLDLSFVEYHTFICPQLCACYWYCLYFWASSSDNNITLELIVVSLRWRTAANSVQQWLLSKCKFYCLGLWLISNSWAYLLSTLDKKWQKGHCLHCQRVKELCIVFLKCHCKMYRSGDNIMKTWLWSNKS